MKNNLKFHLPTVLFLFLFATSAYSQTLYIYPESITYLDKIDGGTCEARLMISSKQYDSINEERKSFGNHAYKKDGVSMEKGATHSYNKANGSLDKIVAGWGIELEFQVWEEDTGGDLDFNQSSCLDCDDDGGKATGYIAYKPNFTSDIIVTKGERYEVKWRYEIK